MFLLYFLLRSNIYFFPLLQKLLVACFCIILIIASIQLTFPILQTFSKSFSSKNCWGKLNFGVEDRYHLWTFCCFSSNFIKSLNIYLLLICYLCCFRLIDLVILHVSLLNWLEISTWWFFYLEGGKTFASTWWIFQNWFFYAIFWLFWQCSSLLLVKTYTLDSFQRWYLDRWWLSDSWNGFIDKLTFFELA